MKRLFELYTILTRRSSYILYSCRVLQRWAGYVMHSEHGIWRYHCLIYPFYLNSTTIHSILTQMTQCRALILYVAAGALQEALAALREAQLPDTAAMFILACHEIHAEIVSDLGITGDESSSSVNDRILNLHALHPENEDVVAVDEYFGQYQRKLVHLCMDSHPSSD